MRKLSEARGVKVAVAALMVAVLLFGAVGAAFADGPAPRPGQAKFEVEFMTMMIDHHASAVEMAELCVEKATHEELRMACEDMVAEQMHEIEMMQMWLMEWYGISHEPQISEDDMMMIEHLAMLEGNEFEVAFMQHMIEHHMMAVKEGVKCERCAYHDELQSMCQDMVESQVAEIMQLQAWLCEWHGMCEMRRPMWSM